MQQVDAQDIKLVPYPNEAVKKAAIEPTYKQEFMYYYCNTTT
jgi:hypothetical protein